MIRETRMVNSVARRRRAVFWSSRANTVACFLLASACALATTHARAQSGTQDSAATYARQARSLAESALATERLRALPLWTRAAALFHEKRDSLNEAKALAGASFAVGGDQNYVVASLSKSLPFTRQAVALYLAVGARSDAADLLVALGPGFLINRDWPLDSAIASRTRALQLYRDLGDRRAEARLLAQEGSYVTGFTEKRDAARRGLAFARSLGDTLAELLALNSLGGAYLFGSSAGDTSASAAVRQTRVDSSKSAFLEGVRLARRISSQTSDSAQRELYYREEDADLTNIITMYTSRNLDTAIHYASEKVRFAQRISDRRRELFAYSSLSRVFNSFGGSADSARYYATRALDIAKVRRDTSSIIGVLRSVVAIETNMGFADSALAHYREIEQLARASGLRSTLALARLDLGDAHAARGNIDSSIAYYRRALDTAQSASSSFQRASAMFGVAEQFLRSSALDSSAHYFRSVEKMDTLYRERARIGLGRIALARGQVDSATIFFEQGLPLATPQQRGDALGWMALTATQRGDLDSSMVLRRRSFAAYARFSDVEGQSTQMSSIGSLFLTRGMPDSALVYYRRALTFDAQSKSRDRERLQLQMMATVFLAADHADSALAFNRRSLALANRFDSPIPKANLFNNIGLVYLNLGQHDSARVYLDRALRINHDGSNVAGEAVNLTNLGLLRIHVGVDDSAFVQLRRAMAEQSELPDRSVDIVPRMYLARAFSVAGLHDSSLVHARAALALSSRASSRAVEGRALAQLGRTYAALGQRDSAQVYFTQAIAMLRRMGMTREVRTTLAEMADLFRSGSTRQSLETATAYYDSAAAVVDDARRGAGGEENEVAISETQVDVFGGWARAWVGRGSDVGASRSAAFALGAVERGRAQSLVDMVTRLQSANRAKALAQYRPSVGSDLSTEVDSLLAPLRASRSAALTYLLAGDTLFTWLLSSTGALELQTPVAITESEFNRLVRSSRRAFAGDETRSAQLDPDELSASDSATVRGNADDDWKRLAALLLPADLSTKVPAGTPIVIVPHGSIGLVPFAALTIKGDTSARAKSKSSSRRAANDTVVTLGSRNPLRFAPSFAALKASESRSVVAVTPALRTTASRNAWRATRATAATSTAAATPATTVATAALVVGNPSMPYVYSGRWTNRAKLQPLPGAEAEARTIATQLGAQVLTGKAATETAVRARMSSAPLIHFATHGLAYGTASAARRSFVAFAPDSAQDGLLTMGELMDDPLLTLHAELVVLSACQTGLGDMKKAEGSVGLQRALLAKGARSVLVSLWNVDDKATRLLMEKFYTYWLDPTTVRSKATALQMAQDAVRRTTGYANPKYWAAFQLVGAE